jgi:hypothetical protein
MKKIVLGVLLVVTTVTNAQKDELKTLKKLYVKEQLSADDFSKYKETVLKLEAVATTEEDKVAAGFYKAMQPIVEMSPRSTHPTLMMIQKLFAPEIFTSIVEGMRKTLEFESKQEKKVFTDDIKNTIDIFKNKIAFFQDLIQNTLLQVERNKLLDIIGISNINSCVDSLKVLSNKICHINQLLLQNITYANCKTIFKKKETLITYQNSYEILEPKIE